MKRFNASAQTHAPAGPMSADEFARRFTASSVAPAPAPAPEAPNTPWRVDSSPNDGAIMSGLKTAVNVVPDVIGTTWGIAKSALTGLRDIPKIVSEEKGAIEDARAAAESAKQLEAMGGPKAPDLASRLGDTTITLLQNTVPEFGRDLSAAAYAGATGKDTFGTVDENIEAARKAVTERPFESIAPFVLGARGAVGAIDRVTRAGAETRMGDYVQNLEQNVRKGEPIPRSTGTSLGKAFDEGVSKIGGAVARPVESAFGKAAESMRGPVQSAEEIAGRVLQGDIASQTVGAKVLSRIDTSKVKTYGDLSKVLDTNVKENLRAVDNEFAKSTEPVKLKDLKREVEADADGVIVKGKINFVEEALSHLLEVAKNTRDVAGEARMKTIIKRAKEQGLTPTDINKIAREYGTEFGKKAFDKMGNPLTSVNARAYENIRKGVKETARSFLKTDEAKAFDKSTHEMLDVKILVDKVNEAVNKLEQKVVKRNLLEKIGRGLGTAVDLATFGGLRAFLARLFPSNIGLKVQNNMDFEAALSKNLETIKKLEGADDATLVSTLIGMAKQLNNLPNDIPAYFNAQETPSAPVARSNFGAPSKALPEATPVIAEKPVAPKEPVAKMEEGLVDSTGKKDLRTVMVGLEKKGYDKVQIRIIMNELYKKNSTGRFTPKEVSEASKMMTPKAAQKTNFGR